MTTKDDAKAARLAAALRANLHRRKGRARETVAAPRLNADDAPFPDRQ